MKSIFDLQNPWRASSYRFDKQPYIARKMFDTLMDHLSKKEITALVGSRQVGKTFLIKKLIQNMITTGKVTPTHIFYFNFDVMELIEFFQQRSDFIDFIQAYGKSDQINYIFLDEFQRIPDGGLLLKSYYDLDLNFKFIISGSSSLEIKSQIKESLAGRKRLLELYPVSYVEFLSYQGVDINQPLKFKFKFEFKTYQKLLDEFVRFGGYPGVITIKDENEKILQLKEIYDSYIKKDISDFLKIENVVGFNRFVQVLSTQPANLFKANGISKIVGLSRYYLDIYLQYLQDTYIVKLLRPYFENLGKSIIKMPKLYFVDSGIRNMVLNQFNSLDQRTDTGALIENFVYSELIKKFGQDNLWFFRTQNGSEVDFFYKRGEEIIPIEVKSTASPSTAIPKIFSSLINSLNFNKAYILTRSIFDDRKINDSKIYFRPVWSVTDLEF